MAIGIKCPQCGEQCHALGLNLMGSSHTETSEYRERRTPSLHCMLGEEGQYDGRQNEPATVSAGGYEPQPTEDARVQFKPRFNVTFALQLFESALDRIVPEGDARPNGDFSLAIKPTQRGRISVRPDSVK